MPFSAELKLPENGQSLKSITICSSLKIAIQNSKPWKGMLSVNATDLLLIENVYGHSYEQNQEDTSLWNMASKSTPLLTEIDFTNPEIEGFVGKWNIPFLCWLKSISFSAREVLSISYEHERGDTPYEYVWWESDPIIGCEKLNVSSHDGRDDAVWDLKIVRHENGKAEISQSGELENIPRYLSRLFK